MSNSLNNLPVQLIPLVGREREILELSNLLRNPEIRLITLYGLGGSGKTRLAIEIGQKALNLFTDGVWFVALAPLSTPESILVATSAAVRFAFSDSNDQKNQLHQFLREKQLLLIFDNLEHLLPQGAVFLEDLLKNAPQARLLVTSRQPINAPWEWAYVLGGLDYQEKADMTKGYIPDAASLFLQHLLKQGQAVTGEDEACATKISHMVAGLPLALLLAASWGRALTCEEIVAEIQRGIGFLQIRQQYSLDRHSSMQAVFDYSWQLLPENEKTILRKLSVFRGGFDRAAARAVTLAGIAEIASLIDKSLVERVANNRYQIHELLRQYLQERLLEAGEHQITHDAHLAYYTTLGEQAGQELFREHQNIWIDRLKSEIDNMGAALEWSLERHDPASIEMGMRLLVATERFWILPLFTRAGMTYLVRFLGLVSENQFQRWYGKGLNLAGWLSYLLEELPESRQYTTLALQIGLQLDDNRLIGDSYYIQSLEVFYRKDHKLAQSYASQSLAYYQKINDAHGTLQALECLGRCEIYNSDFSAARLNLTAGLTLANKLGDIRIQYSILRGLGELGLLGTELNLQQARTFFLEGISYARKFKDMFYISHTLNSLGEISRMEGQFEQAAKYYEEAISIDKELGLNDEIILHEGNLGFVYSRLGKINESKRLFLKNLGLALKSDHLSLEITTSLFGLADVAIMQGEAKLAAKFLGAIDSEKERLLFSPTERSDYERILAAVKTQLTDREFDQCFKEGQAIGQAQAAQVILNQGGKESSLKSERLNGLTPREIEILRLVTMGLSDQELARRLVLSPRTINAHLTSIYSKLGVNSRAAASIFAREKGLG